MLAIATVIATVTPSKIGPSLIMIHPPPLVQRFAVVAQFLYPSAVDTANVEA